MASHDPRASRATIGTTMGTHTEPVITGASFPRDHAPDQRRRLTSRHRGELRSTRDQRPVESGLSTRAPHRATAARSPPRRELPHLWITTPVQLSYLWKLVSGSDRTGHSRQHPNH